MGIRVDLRVFQLPLVEAIQESLDRFVEGHPDCPISIVGLFGDAFHGTASLHLQTPHGLAAEVKQWAKGETAWAYSTDKLGIFCDNCWDFEHCIGEYRFTGYPNLYEVDPDSDGIEYVTLDGTISNANSDEGNEGKNRIVFPFLKQVLWTFDPLPTLCHADPFRVGVQMHDSDFKEFWVR